MKLIDLVNSVIICLPYTILLRWIAVLLGSLTVTLTVLLFWTYFFLLILYFFCSCFPPIGKFGLLLSQFPSTFRQTQKWTPLFYCTAYDYSRADWDDLCDHLRNIPSEVIFKLGASTAAAEFCEWVQVVIDVHISHRKY